MEALPIYWCQENLIIAAQATEVSLFSNLSSDVKPIATRSRRYGENDRAFIDENIKKLMDEDIIRPSSSPWRAQVVIVNDQFNRHKKRMCVDYLQSTFIPN